MKDCPLVKIDWEDSRQPTSNWSWLSEFKPNKVVECSSVGWLIHNGEDIKVLTPNFGDLENEKDLQISGSIEIPASCIVKITNLTETVTA